MNLNDVLRKYFIGINYKNENNNIPLIELKSIISLNIYSIKITEFFGNSFSYLNKNKNKCEIYNHLKPFSNYCNNCKEIICNLCTKNYHNNHSIYSIEFNEKIKNFFDSSYKKMNNLYKEVKEKLIKFYKNKSQYYIQKWEKINELMILLSKKLLDLFLMKENEANFILIYNCFNIINIREYYYKEIINNINKLGEFILEINSCKAYLLKDSNLSYKSDILLGNTITEYSIKNTSNYNLIAFINQLNSENNIEIEQILIKNLIKSNKDKTMIQIFIILEKNGLRFYDSINFKLIEKKYFKVINSIKEIELFDIPNTNNIILKTINFQLFKNDINLDFLKFVCRSNNLISYKSNKIDIHNILKEKIKNLKFSFLYNEKIIFKINNNGKVIIYNLNTNQVELILKFNLSIISIIDNISYYNELIFISSEFIYYLDSFTFQIKEIKEINFEFLKIIENNYEGEIDFNKYNFMLVNENILFITVINNLFYPYPNDEWKLNEINSRYYFIFLNIKNLRFITQINNIIENICITGIEKISNLFLIGEKLYFFITYYENRNSKIAIIKKTVFNINTYINDFNEINLYNLPKNIIGFDKLLILNNNNILLYKKNYISLININ